MTKILLIASACFIGFAATPSWADDEELNMFRASVEGRFETLQAQIAELRGMVEQATHENKVLQKELERALKDIDFRFNEKGGATEPGSTEGSLKEPSKVDSVDTGTPKDLYDAALSLYNDEKYADAVTKFKQFIKKHPKDDLIASAKYWLGEAYYAKGDFEDAAIQFADVYQNHKKHAKSPNALIKLGLALKGQKKKTDACVVLKQFAKDFPKASDSAKALHKKVSQDLKC